MASFLSSSRDVVLDMTDLAVHGAGMALHVACLPVTLPLHVMGEATHLVVGAVGHVLLSSVALVHNTLNSTSGDDLTSSIDQTDVVPLVLGAAEHIKNDIGGMLLGFISPLFGVLSRSPEQERQEQISARESSSEQESFLDRLRLDFPHAIDETKAMKQVSASEVSKHLLRVDDLDVLTDSGLKVLFIDLSPDFINDGITSRAMDAFLVEGLALVSTGTEKPQSKFDGAINWKSEGATQRLLKKRNKMPSDQWYAMMEKEVLVWSGTFNRGENRVCDSPIFLSRGIICGSSRNVFDLLWDSNRTTEYNKFCMGRSDAVVIVDENDPSLDGRFKAIKVVKSETRVPFTSFSVVMTTLMYASELDNEGTYLIVSRSLASGGAGHHTDRRRVERDRKNEITWGVNLIRPVPGNLKATDLVTSSQICSPLVPRFLQNKVGMMAVDNAFNALRSLDL